MQCTHCNIWRPRDGFNTITAISEDGRTHTTIQYCRHDDICRLESIFAIQKLKKANYTVAQTHPITLEDEVSLMRRLLRVESGITCNTCHHDSAYHTVHTVRGLGCEKQVTTAAKCTCLQFIPYNR